MDHLHTQRERERDPTSDYYKLEPVLISGRVFENKSITTAAK